MSDTKTVYPSQEWTENFSGGIAPRSGRAAAQGNETARGLGIGASGKRHRGAPQRIGARAWDETHEIWGAEPSRFVALSNRCRLKRETIFKSARFPDDTSRSEPRLRAQGSSFCWFWQRRPKQFVYR